MTRNKPAPLLPFLGCKARDVLTHGKTPLILCCTSQISPRTIEIQGFNLGDRPQKFCMVSHSVRLFVAQCRGLSHFSAAHSLRAGGTERAFVMAKVRPYE